MDLKPLPFDASLEAYDVQASALLDAHRNADPGAIQVFHHKHPRFLDEKVPWLPKDVPDSEIQNAALDLADARLALARWYDFRDWAALTAYAAEVSRKGSAVHRFEAAVDAVINGDTATLNTLLHEDPELVRARSTRVTHFDPPRHGATLLHYIAANGTEGYRQRTPANAVELARILLGAGAEPDALADLYGGRCTTLSLLVSSCHPAQAGVQVALVDTLVDFGASVEAVGEGKWRSPLLTALVFGYRDAAEALVRRGARVETLPAAAGLGRFADAKRLLASADADSRHRALALAAQLGHVEIVELLLEAGEDPDRYSPPGMHAHATPLHQAALAGHEGVVRVLVEGGARLDLEDTIYKSTPLGWARYAGRTSVAEYLTAKGAA